MSDETSVEELKGLLETAIYRIAFSQNESKFEEVATQNEKDAMNRPLQHRVGQILPALIDFQTRFWGEE